MFQAHIKYETRCLGQKKKKNGYNPCSLRVHSTLEKRQTHKQMIPEQQTITTMICSTEEAGELAAWRNQEMLWKRSHVWIGS